MQYVFDGSLEGLLTAIFEYYERRPQQVTLVWDIHHQPGIFEETLTIISDNVKATRVWKGLSGKLPASWLRRFYSTWLSEQPESFQHLFDFARYIFDSPAGAETNYGHPPVLAVAQIDRQVHREKHRMEAFVRFQKAGDGLYWAQVSPDYNVLPLIIPHFRNRYADQSWIIYDLKRKYGIHYDGITVHEVTFDFVPGTADINQQVLDGNEELYTLLWQDYFKSTNIPSRKNLKLHIRHVPRRYWKYLPEKKNPGNS